MLAALFYVKDGQAVPTMSVTSGAQLKPESSVLWWKIFVLPAANVMIPISDGGPVQIKTKRKMMQGDQLVFSTLGSVAVTAQIFTNHTHFFKA